MNDTKPTEIVFLKGKKTVLRLLTKDDLPLITKWINDAEVTQYLCAYLPATLEDEEAWLEGVYKKKQTDMVFGIEAEGKLIGVMGIHGISWRDRTATTGVFIGEKDYWGKGYGTDAKMALLHYAFDTLNLHKMCSSVIAFNKRSLHYSLHCGYKVEGTKKKHRFRNGKYHDEIMLALFRKDWLPYWKKYNKE